MADPTIRIFLENGEVSYATSNIRREIILEVYDLDAGDEDPEDRGFEEIDIA